MTELLSDIKFQNGFDLLTTSTNNGRELSGYLNYGGQALAKANWQLSQWWTPFDFINARLTNPEDGAFVYSNESRKLTVNQNEGSIILDLNSKVEYQEKFGRNRTGNENWSHMLIEQSLSNPKYLKDLNSLYARMEFELINCTDLSIGQELPCAQISWYFTITNVKNGNPAYESGDNDFFWFGLPLFDSRFDYIEEYQHVDSGFVGATNKLIYKVGSRSMFNSKIIPGKKFEISINILPLLKKAYQYGKSHGALQDSSFEDLCINYMNLGWEMPGSMSAAIKIKNLQLLAEEKVND